MKADGVTSLRLYRATRRTGKYQEFPSHLRGIYGESTASLFGSINFKDKTFPPVEEFKARLLVDGVAARGLYQAARRAGKYLEFPNSPIIYGESWSSLFGNSAPKDKTFPPVEGFKAWMKADGVSDYKQYRAARRAGKYLEFPSEPHKIYDRPLSWLFGTIASFNKTFPPVEEFKARMKADGVSAQHQYGAARKAGRYAEFPGRPDNTYGEPWSSLFGKKPLLTRNVLAEYLREFFTRNTGLDAPDLYYILAQMGALPTVMRITGAATPESAIQKLKQLTAAEIDSAVQRPADDDLADDDADDRLPGSDDAPDDAPLIVADLHAADHPRLSADAVAMLVNRRLNKLWDLTIRDGYNAAAALLVGDGGTYFRQIRDRFQ